MSGPAIRAFQLGRVLSEVTDVTLAGAGDASVAPSDGLAHVAYRPHDPRALREPIAAADMIVAQPQWPLVTRWMAASGARLVFDLFVPEELEALERYPGRRSWRARLLMGYMHDRFVDAVRVGHDFICSGERQREYWTQLMAREGVPPEAARERIQLVPYGTPPEPPIAVGTGGAAARFAGVEAGDEVMLWTSAIWPWFDAETAVRAAALVAERRPRARLVFMGQGSGAAAEAADRARRLASSIGTLDSVVFFNDSWVPYDQRIDWLLEASCAVSTHYENLETRYAFRTRFLDCFWAGLPIVSTRGDELADSLEGQGLGLAVPEKDPEALAAALEQVLERGREAYAPALARAAERFSWQRTAQPLIEMAQSADLPPRLGTATTRRPAHLARSAAYTTAQAALARAGATRLSGRLSAREG